MKPVVRQNHLLIPGVEPEAGRWQRPRLPLPQMSLFSCLSRKTQIAQNHTSRQGRPEISKVCYACDRDHNTHRSEAVGRAKEGSRSNWEPTPELWNQNPSYWPLYCSTTSLKPDPALLSCSTKQTSPQLSLCLLTCLAFDVHSQRTSSSRIPVTHLLSIMAIWLNIMWLMTWTSSGMLAGLI
jgi:hypothetical protein